jgi:hypothetical protein
MRKTLVIGIGVTAVAALALGGVTVSAAAGSASSRRPVVVSATTKAGGVSVAEARRLAEAAVPGGHAVQVEFDDVADRRVWKVIVDGAGGRVSVWVDAATGLVSVGKPSDNAAATSGMSGLDDDAVTASGARDDDATRGGDDDDASDDRSSAAEDRRDDHGRGRGEHGRSGQGSAGQGSAGQGSGRDDGPAHR